jgi:hypothetical protein
MTTRVCLTSLHNTDTAESDTAVKEVSIGLALELYSALTNLNNMVMFIAEHKELANILEENEDGTVNTNSLPREMRPQFEVLIRSIQSSLKSLEK